MLLHLSSVTDPVQIKSVEVSGDNRDGYGKSQDSGQSAGGSDQPAPRSHRHLVPVPHGCHGDDRPPERIRDAVDLGIGGIPSSA